MRTQHKLVPVSDTGRIQHERSREEQRNALRHQLVQLRKIAHKALGEQLRGIKLEMLEKTRQLHTL